MRIALALLFLPISSCAAQEEPPRPHEHFLELDAILPWDDGYLVGGLGDLDAPPGGSDAVGRTRAWIGWADASGHLLRHLDLEEERSVMALARLADGGFLACGAGWYGAFDLDGGTRSVVHGPVDWRSAARGEDGTILLVGDRSGGPALALHVGAAGEPIEERELVSGAATAREVAAAPGGGWVAIGWRWAEGTPTEGWVVRLDARGAPVWRSALTDPEDTYGQAIAPHAGGFVAVGFSGPTGSLRGWVRGLDPEGGETWTRDLVAGDLSEVAVGVRGEIYVLGRREGGGFLVRVDVPSEPEALPGRYPYAATGDARDGSVLAGGMGPGGVWIERVVQGPR